jgi:6-phosphogluconolactonase/glucosamine-6-phosphate isomerase/deaminase
LSLRNFPWNKTRLWLTDEIAAPEADESRRGLALRELLVTQSGIPEEQVHLIEGWRPDADAAYEGTLREVLGWREKGHDRLDAVLVSMDEHGGVAGLSQGSAALLAADRLVVRQPGTPDEILMTLTLLNASRVVAVVATGKHLQPTLKRLETEHRAGAASTGSVPAGRLLPTGGELRWYVDEESL